REQSRRFRIGWMIGSGHSAANKVFVHARQKRYEAAAGIAARVMHWLFVHERMIDVVGSVRFLRTT
ncbi:MAG: hypothetical protein ABI442_20760, partial [Gemmatimonadaceae bacterium]